MGQPITVVEKPSSNPAVLRFETNRPLTGMGHERYTSPPGELLIKTGDELARRLFAAGGIETVHINGSVVTVTLSGGQTGAGLGDIVRNLFLHYGEQPAAPAEAPVDEADSTSEALADPAEAPAAEDAEEPAAAEPVVEADSTPEALADTAEAPAAEEAEEPAAEEPDTAEPVVEDPPTDG